MFGGETKKNMNNEHEMNQERAENKDRHKTITGANAIQKQLKLAYH